ncbi:MAG TPA: hypothetical protein VKV95_05935 [Terriglobia bacterium]|nr:hypothetical protein [Terriglobia bacterium]
MEKFSAVTTDMITAVGAWRYQGTLFEDQLLRLIVDIPTSAQGDSFFREYKEVLKARFDQIDIWISGHEIRIL